VLVLKGKSEEKGLSNSVPNGTGGRGFKRKDPNTFSKGKKTLESSVERVRERGKTFRLGGP